MTTERDYPTTTGKPAVPQRHRWRRDDRGSVTAELVIITPILLLLLLVIVQFALWSHATHIAQAAASEALAATRVQGGSSVDGQAQARQLLDRTAHGLLLTPQVGITKSATTVTGQITGQTIAVVPFLTVPVRADTTGPVERVTTPDSERDAGTGP